MEDAIRQVCYDETLQISAYYFRRLQKGFVNHFHGYYVFGLIEAGSTVMSCRQQEYQLERAIYLFSIPAITTGVCSAAASRWSIGR